MNLINHAIQYNHKDGRVDVRWMKQNDSLVIEVSDTGIGIPDDHVDLIIDRFSRVDDVRQNSHAASGLSLAIVKAIVEYHGGSTTVESQLDHGSRFSIALPLI